MTDRQSAPGVHENFAATVETPLPEPKMPREKSPPQGRAVGEVPYEQKDEHLKQVLVPNSSHNPSPQSHVETTLSAPAPISTEIFCGSNGTLSIRERAKDFRHASSDQQDDAPFPPPEQHAHHERPPNKSGSSKKLLLKETDDYLAKGNICEHIGTTAPGPGEVWLQPVDNRPVDNGESGD